MKKPLISVVFASEKRKNVLQLLQDGPTEMECILQSLNDTRQALLPQMKILETHHLINHDRHNDIYELTCIGKIITDKLNHVLKILDFFEIDNEYWGTHIFDFLSFNLMENMGEVGKHNVIHGSVDIMYTVDPTYFESSSRSKSCHTILSFIHPNSIPFFVDMIHKNVKVYVIFVQDVFNKVKNEYCSELRELINSDSAYLYLYQKEATGFLGITWNDYHTYIMLHRNDGSTDFDYVLCPIPDAADWNKEVFGFYLKDSIELTEL